MVRKFEIGYNRASRLIQEPEENGGIGLSVGTKPREILIKKEVVRNMPF